MNKSGSTVCWAEPCLLTIGFFVVVVEPYPTGLYHSFMLVVISIFSALFRKSESFATLAIKAESECALCSFGK